MTANTSVLIVINVSLFHCRLHIGNITNTAQSCEEGMPQSCSFQKLSAQKWASIFPLQLDGSFLSLCQKTSLIQSLSRPVLMALLSSHRLDAQSYQVWHELLSLFHRLQFLSARAARGKITGFQSAWKGFIFHSSVFITQAFIWYNHSHHAKLTENWDGWFIPIAGRLKSRKQHNIQFNSSM